MKMDVQVWVPQGCGDHVLDLVREHSDVLQASGVVPSPGHRLLDVGAWDVIAVVATGLSFLMAIRDWWRTRKEAETLRIKVVIEQTVVIDIEELSDSHDGRARSDHDAPLFGGKQRDDGESA
jgi:hypothetical protein